MRTRRLLLIPLLVLVGCSDPLGPEDVSGVYELTAFRSVEMPVTIVDDSHSYEVVSGQLYLLADGTSRHVRSVRVDSQTTMVTDYTLAYELHGNEIRWVRPACPPEIACMEASLPARLRVIGNRLLSSSEAGEQYVRRGDL